MDHKMIQRSILAQNLDGQNFLHFLVDADLQKWLIIQFLDLLKVHFGLKFVGKIF
jgi:hypothetical protein